MGICMVTIEKVKQKFDLFLEVIIRTDTEETFKVLPKRWIVERSFAWFESYRRLRKTLNIILIHLKQWCN